eukprot:m.64260 g.64260  ORF g.64260 m.64260 type:complete len:284 (-) comp13484_c0_seq2:288-1139(-)
MDAVVSALRHIRDEEYMEELHRRLLTLLTQFTDVREEGIVADGLKVLCHFLYYSTSYLRRVPTPAEEYFGLQLEEAKAGNPPSTQRLRGLGLWLLFSPSIVTLLSRWQSDWRMPKGVTLEQLLGDGRLVLSVLLPGFISLGHTILGMRYASRQTSSSEGSSRSKNTWFLSVKSLLLIVAIANLVVRVGRIGLNWRQQVRSQDAYQTLIGKCQTQPSDHDLTLPEDSPPSCILCLDTRKDTTCTRCGHLGCWQCLATWVAQERCCPVCRQALEMKDLFPIFNSS